jgi:hypothetical protein
MLSIDDRINFYLGEEFINQSHIDATAVDTMTVDQLPGIKPEYEDPLKQLLIDTNNADKKFLLCAGDIRHKPPIYAFCKNRMAEHNSSVILRCLNFVRHWPDYYDRPNDIPFDDKIDKIIWRGDTTGYPDIFPNRFQLVSTWFDKHDLIDVAFSGTLQNIKGYNKFIKIPMPIEEMLNYKYILSVEGNDKDSGINWKLNSNSVVLMAKPRCTSWLMETTLMPDFHYVLLKDDFSDLYEKLEWCIKNQDRCKEIVENANDFMMQFADSEQEQQIEHQVINRYFEIFR